MIALLAFLLFILSAKIKVEEEKDMTYYKAREARKELRQF